MGFLKDDRIKGLPLLVLANKQDRPDAAGSTEIAEKFQLSRLDLHRKWRVQGISVVKNEGLIEGFNWMADRIKAKKLQISLMNA